MGARLVAETPSGTTAKSTIPRWQLVVAGVGVSLWVVAIIAVGILWFQAPTQAIAALLAVGAFYYSGQFGAMPLGLAAGGDPVIVGSFVWIADMAGLLVFFPITQFGVDRLANHPGVFAKWIRAMQMRGHRRRGFIQKYGPFGLFVFTALPFLFNSPILGCVIGRLAGIWPRRTLFAVGSAVTVMSFVWIVVFAILIEEANNLDPRLPWVIGIGSVAITAVLAGVFALSRRLMRRRVSVTPEPDLPGSP